MYAQFVTISRFDFAKVFAVLVVLASALALLLPVFLVALLLLAQALWCVLLSQIKRNHCCCTSSSRANVQLGERVDFLRVAACAMKYCK